mgnify:CR=1 FL=1
MTAIPWKPSSTLACFAMAAVGRRPSAVTLGPSDKRRGSDLSNAGAAIPIGDNQYEHP